MNAAAQVIVHEKRGRRQEAAAGSGCEHKRAAAGVRVLLGVVESFWAENYDRIPSRERRRGCNRQMPSRGAGVLCRALAASASDGVGECVEEYGENGELR